MPAGYYIVTDFSKIKTKQFSVSDDYVRDVRDDPRWNSVAHPFSALLKLLKSIELRYVHSLINIYNFDVRVSDNYVHPNRLSTTQMGRIPKGRRIAAQAIPNTSH